MESCISLIVSIISAVATAIMAFLTYKALKENAKNIEINNNILEHNRENTFELTRPYIVLKIFSENLSLYLRIENTGQTIAKNINISITPSLDDLSCKDLDSYKLEYRNLFTQAVMLPRSFVETEINANPEIFKMEHVEDILNIERQVQINYKTASGRELSENYTIIISNFLTSNNTASFSMNYHLKNINDTLKKLSRR